MVDPSDDRGRHVAPTPSLAQVYLLYKKLYNCNFIKCHIIILCLLRF